VWPPAAVLQPAEVVRLPASAALRPPVTPAVRVLRPPLVLVWWAAEILQPAEAVWLSATWASQPVVQASPPPPGPVRRARATLRRMARAWPPAVSVLQQLRALVCPPTASERRIRRQ